MKKQYVILLCICALSVLATAQTNKGQWMLGSTIGLAPASELDLGGIASDNHAGVIVYTTAVKSGGLVERFNTTTFSVAPAIGYFVADGWMIGVNTSLTFLKPETAQKSTTLGMTPMVRKYFLLTGKTKPFLEARGGFIHRKLEGADGSFYPIFGGRGGAAIFVNEAVSLDFFLDYGYSYIKDLKHDADNLPESTNKAFGFGLGFSYFW